MDKTRSYMLLSVVFAVAALGIGYLLVQGKHRGTGPPEKIAIAYATLPETALAQVAQSQGFYREAGLEATAQVYPYGKLALQEVLEGKADIATVAETPVMFAIMRGEKIAVIATIYASRLGHAIMARRDRGILTFEDLKGKTIAVTSGTTADFFLDVMLVTHGISRKDIEVVDLKAEEIPDALARGEIDAVCTFTPYTDLTQKKLGNGVIAFRDSDIYRYTFNVVATQEFIRKNPEKVRKVLRALIRAEEFVKVNPIAAQHIVADFCRTEMGTVSTIWGDASFAVMLDQALVLALEDETRWAMNSRLIDRKKMPNYLDFFYLDGLRSVKPEAVRILR